jgi:hypothetical protein
MVRAKTVAKNYPTMLVLAAANAAYRKNQGYVKPGYELAGTTETPRKSNRELVYYYLDNTSELIEEDHEVATKIKAWYQGKTFKILSGSYVSDFDHNVLKMLEQEETPEGYNLAVLASTPGSYFTGIQRDVGESRVKFAQGGYLGTVGDKVETKCEVMKCIYSQKWGVFFVTAITDNDQAIFFSYKEEISYGKCLTIKGNVKRQDNNTTQLNRVKVIA